MISAHGSLFPAIQPDVSFIPSPVTEHPVVVSLTPLFPIFSAADQVLAHLYQLGICNQWGEMNADKCASSSFEFFLNPFQDQATIQNIIDFLQKPYQLLTEHCFISFNLYTLFKQIMQTDHQTLQIIGSSVFQLLEPSVFAYLVLHCFGAQLSPLLVEDLLKLPHVQKELNKSSQDSDCRFKNRGNLSQQAQLTDQILSELATLIPPDLNKKANHAHPYIIKRQLVKTENDHYAIVAIASQNDKPIDLVFVGCKEDGTSGLKNTCLSSSNCWTITIKNLFDLGSPSSFQIESSPFPLAQALIDLLCDYATPVDCEISASWLRFLREGKRLRRANSEQQMVKCVLNQKQTFLAQLNSKRIRKNKKEFSNTSDGFYFYHLLKETLSKTRKNYSSSHEKAEFALQFVLRASLSLATHASATDETLAELWHLCEKKGYFYSDTPLTHPFYQAMHQALIQENVPFSLLSSWLGLMAWMFKPTAFTYHNQHPIFHLEEGFSCFLIFEPNQVITCLKESFLQQATTTSLKNIYFYFASCSPILIPSPLAPYLSPLSIDLQAIEQAALQWLDQPSPFLKAVGLQLIFTLPNLSMSQRMLHRLMIHLPTIIREIPQEHSLAKKNILETFYTFDSSFLFLLEPLKQSMITLQQEIHWLLGNTHELFIAQAYQLWKEAIHLQEIKHEIHLNVFRALCRWRPLHALQMATVLSQKKLWTKEEENLSFLYLTHAYQTHFKSQFLVDWEIYNPWFRNVLDKKYFLSCENTQFKQQYSQCLCFILNTLYDVLSISEGDTILIQILEDQYLNNQQQTQVILKRMKQLPTYPIDFFPYLVSYLLSSSKSFSTADFQQFFKKQGPIFYQTLMSYFKKDLSVENQLKILDVWSVLISSDQLTFLSSQQKVEDLEIIYNCLPIEQLYRLWLPIEQTLRQFKHTKDFSFFVPFVKLFAQLWIKTQTLPTPTLVQWIQEQQKPVFEKLFQKGAKDVIVLLLKAFYRHQFLIKEIEKYAGEVSIAYPLIKDETIASEEKFQWILGSLHSTSPSQDLLQQAVLCTQWLIDQEKIPQALVLLNQLYIQDFFKEGELKNLTDQIYKPNKISSAILEEQFEFLLQQAAKKNVSYPLKKCFHLALFHLSSLKIQRLLTQFLKTSFFYEAAEWLVLWQALESYPQSELFQTAWLLFEQNQKHLMGSSSELAHCWAQVFHCLSLANQPNFCHYFDQIAFLDSIFGEFLLLKQQVENELLIQISRLPSSYHSIAFCQKIIDKKNELPLNQELNQNLLKNLPLLNCLEGFVWGKEIISKELNELNLVYDPIHYIKFIKAIYNNPFISNLQGVDRQVFIQHLSELALLFCQEKFKLTALNLNLFALWQNYLSDDAVPIQFKILSTILNDPMSHELKSFESLIYATVLKWVQQNPLCLNEITPFVEQVFQLFKLSPDKQALLSESILNQQLSSLLDQTTNRSDKQVFQLIQKWGPYTFYTEESLNSWIPRVMVWMYYSLTQVSFTLESCEIFAKKLHQLLNIKFLVLKSPNKNNFLKGLKEYEKIILNSAFQSIHSLPSDQVPKANQLTIASFGSFIEKLVDSPQFRKENVDEIFSLMKFLVYLYLPQTLPSSFNWEQSKDLLSDHTLSPELIPLLVKNLLEKMDHHHLFNQKKDIYFEWSFWVHHLPSPTKQYLKANYSSILRLLNYYLDLEDERVIFVYRAIHLLALLHLSDPTSKNVKKLKYIQEKILKAMLPHATAMIEDVPLLSHLYDHTFNLKMEDIHKENKELLEFFQLYRKSAIQLFHQASNSVRFQKYYLNMYFNFTQYDNHLNLDDQHYLKLLDNLEEIIPLIKNLELNPAFYCQLNLFDHVNRFTTRWITQLTTLPSRIQENLELKLKSTEIKRCRKIIYKFLTTFLQLEEDQNLEISCDMCLIVMEHLLKFPQLFSPDQAETITLINQLSHQIEKLNMPIVFYRFLQFKIQFYSSQYHQNYQLFFQMVHESLDLIPSSANYLDIFAYMKKNHENFKLAELFSLPNQHHHLKQSIYEHFLIKIQPLLLNISSEEKTNAQESLIHIYKIGLASNLIDFSKVEMKKLFDQSFRWMADYHPAIATLFDYHVHSDKLTSLSSDKLFIQVEKMLSPLAHYVLNYKKFSISFLFIKLLRQLPQQTEDQLTQKQEFFTAWLVILSAAGDEAIKSHIAQVLSEEQNKELLVNKITLIKDKI